MSVPSYIKLSPQMDMATLINALNTNFNQVQSQDRRKVITDEDGNDRIVLGKQEDGTYAIRVAGTGKDVDTASQSDLVMSSDWKMWKIINSGSSTLTPASIRRSGTVSLTSTNIGYTSDVFIYIEGLAELLASVQGFTGKLQVFVREDTNKKDIGDSNIFYFDGTNWATYNHSYFVNKDGYLVIRTDIRWMAGTVTFTPRSNGLPASSIYWEIANPTRQVPGGQGGGGSPTGKTVTYDSVVLNGSSASITKYEWNNGYAVTTVAPGAFSPLYSYTYQFFDNATSWFYPKDSPVPQIPPLV
jgi:hypothetical protein